MAAQANDADIIVAAGDVDQQAEGVKWLQRLEKPVVYVAGNHEVWGGDLEGTYDALREACEGTNIHFLENDQITIDEVTFFGCSLWVDFFDGNEQLLEYAQLYMNDFVYVTDRGLPLSPEALIEKNIESVRWLESSLAKPTDKKRVVVTHHAPSLRSWGFDEQDPLRYAYCNNLDDMARQYDIALWAHGHVHCRSDYRIANTRVVCNPRGYYKHKLVDEFDVVKVVEI